MTHNKEQQKAILHNKGPAMVLAGPGAGKTFVITNRVKMLIDKYKVSPEKILVVTFSKAAAIEMKERFDAMQGDIRLPVRFGTFHSVFFQILRVAYRYTAKDIVTQGLKYRFLEEVLADIHYEIEDKKEFLEAVEKEISKVKSEGIDIECYYSTNCPEQVFRDIYQGYQAKLHYHGCLDFDDMVVYTYQLLTARQDILSRWQQQFEYILIDEFQDINRLQYENICMLAKPENNIFIVGDDDQSIYGFRGARPDIMLSFPKQFPGTKKFVLATNYRCSSQILTAAGKLIEHNKKRFEKKLTAYAGKIEGVHISRCKDLPAQDNKIVNQIQQYRKMGMEYTDMAVLFRTNMQMRTLASKLMERAIPFTMKEKLSNIFDTWLAKDLLSYVKIALGDYRREHFLKICNRPVRYLSRAAFEQQEVVFDDLREYYVQKEQMWMLERLDDFENQLRALKTMSPYSAIHYIRKGIGYDVFLEEYADERNVNVDDWFEVLDEVQETARDLVNLTEWLSYVEQYGDMLEELAREQQTQQEQMEGVCLLTMHAAKGLEFQTVFIPTINEGMSPYRKSIHIGDVEEERRMLYVAMTRAKAHLHLSFVNEIYHKSAEPSRFLQEIAPEIKEKVTAK